jgi:hypothetical protein
MAMDPETAKAIAELSGRFSLLGALVGALVGGLIAGVVNYVVARQNRATQVNLAEQERATRLALDRAQARRGRREREVQGTLELIKMRVGTLYGPLYDATRAQDLVALEALERGAWRTTHMLHESAWLAVDGFSKTHPLAIYMAAEWSWLQRAKEYSAGTAPYTAYEAAYQDVLRALIAVYEEGERRIDVAGDAT